MVVFICKSTSHWMKLAGFSEPCCHTTANRGSKGVGNRVEECCEGIREREKEKGEGGTQQ
jgi:hypothetical protein